MFDSDGRGLLAIMGPRNVRRLSADAPVWRIAPRGFMGMLFGRNSDFERRQRALLEEVLKQFPGILLADSDGPGRGGAGSGDWERVGLEMWRVPSSANADEMLTLLSEGNWTLFVSAKPKAAKAVMSLLTSDRPDAVLCGMQMAGVEFLLDAWYDNDCWTLAVLPAAERVSEESVGTETRTSADAISNDAKE